MRALFKQKQVAFMTNISPQNITARIGETHGYRFDGDFVYLNADVNFSEADLAAGAAWSLQLLASESGRVRAVQLKDGREIPGCRVRKRGLRERLGDALGGDAAANEASRLGASAGRVAVLRADAAIMRGDIAAAESMLSSISADTGTDRARIAGGIALLRPGAPFDELHDEMLRLTPAGAELELHVRERVPQARVPAVPGDHLAALQTEHGAVRGTAQVERVGERDQPGLRRLLCRRPRRPVFGMALDLDVEPVRELVAHDLQLLVDATLLYLSQHILEVIFIDK